jgi:hypothetical protein
MTRWLADTQAIAALTGRKPATIRSWAHRYPDRLPRRGTSRPRGRGQPRALYDVEEAEKLAASLAALENRGIVCNTEPSAGACPPAAPPVTISKACKDSAAAGLPVEERRLRAIIRNLPGLTPVGEVRKPPGSKGGRGPAVYEIGELQHLITALKPWLTAQDT